MEAVKYAKKVEINPTNTQKQTINQTVGNCRFIFNLDLRKGMCIQR